MEGKAAKKSVKKGDVVTLNENDSQHSCKTNNGPLANSTGAKKKTNRIEGKGWPQLVPKNHEPSQPTQANDGRPREEKNLGHGGGHEERESREAEQDCRKA